MSKLRLALVNPPQPYLVEQHTQVPLGLLYLSAVVKRDCPDVDVTLVDCSALSVEEALAALGFPNMWAFDIIGFTATSLDYHSAVAVKDAVAGSPLPCFIIGGPHVTAQSCAVDDGWNHVFIGEAEKTLPQFLRHFQTGEARTLYIGDNTVDMNTLPRPDRDAFPWIGGRVLTTKHHGSINIMASRGCSFRCTFCASETMWGRKVRWRTPEDVVDEIHECIDKYGVKIFRFSDDNIAGNRKWNKRFCALVKPLDITWRLSVRVDCVTPDSLKMMAEAGCKEMGFGVESFDPQVLKMLNKRITPEQSVRAIHNAHAAGIGTRVLMMISTPGETYKHTVDLNIAALEELKEEFVYLSIKVYKPLPGTAIWNDPAAYGVKIVSKDFSKYNFYVYRKGESGAKEKLLWSPLRIDPMTEEQQQENIVRMVEYSETLPQNADG